MLKPEIYLYFIEKKFYKKNPISFRVFFFNYQLYSCVVQNNGKRFFKIKAKIIG